jgi:hypothetical protein
VNPVQALADVPPYIEQKRFEHKPMPKPAPLSPLRKSRLGAAFFASDAALILDRPFCQSPECRQSWESKNHHILFKSLLTYTIYSGNIEPAKMN